MTEDILFNVKYDEKSLNIVLGSALRKIDDVSEAASSFLEKYGLKEHVFPVCLVLREGLSNAVRHAHKSDPGKIIKFGLRITERELIMEIEDEGCGFDWRDRMQLIEGEVPDPVLEHGRGMKIMDQYFCNVSYNDKGNKLILKKRLEK